MACDPETTDDEAIRAFARRIVGLPTVLDLEWMCAHPDHSLVMIEVDEVFVPMIIDADGNGPVIPTIDEIDGGALQDMIEMPGLAYWQPATAKDAYQAVCRIVARDGAAGMETEGILDNVMAELAASTRAYLINRYVEDNHCSRDAASAALKALTMPTENAKPRCPHCGRTDCLCSDDTRERARRWHEHTARATAADEDCLGVMRMPTADTLAEATMLALEYLLAPDDALTTSAQRLKHRIAAAVVEAGRDDAAWLGEPGGE